MTKTRLVMVLRLLLGLVFVIFGLNGFFNFIPVPPMTPRGGAFLGALMATGYMMYWVKLVEVVCGMLLLTGRYMPLALILLGPIVLNILAFHLILEPKGAPIALVVTAMWATLIVLRWDRFRSLVAR